MHATEPNNDKNKTLNHESHACSYALESLMAIQKALENGFPECEPSHGPTQRSTAANSPQSTPRGQVSAPVLRVGLDWRKSWRLLLMKLTKSREAGKGNAHHTV
ncbi:MAG TPA: hypothetical protein VFP59_15380 [Candidatus Angelobacter sp.]|nr:hypothetical protein [Candidatus Angelobacter sp.]